MSLISLVSSSLVRQLSPWRAASVALLLGLPALTAVGCGAEDTGPDGSDPDDPSGLIDPKGNDGGGSLDPSGLKDAPPSESCGDGELDDDEACDDGGNEPDDGCWANCLGLDPGFTCSQPGQPCRPFAQCGDGLATFPEQCDDGGLESGDGCSATCKVELGYKCPIDDDRVSVCEPTVCGDGKVEGAETCDDGNSLPFDGCSSDCVAEPSCSGGACTSECGDGIVLEEDCDDGNTIDGDGCSSSCEVEEGYVCDAAADCERDAAGNCTLRIPAIFRDFAQSHSDFQDELCDTSQLEEGRVKDRLVGGKPVPTKDEKCWHVTDWYTSSSDNVTVKGQLVLYDNGAGGFVNRWGPNGEQFAGPADYSKLKWCGNGGGKCAGCAMQPGDICFDPCTPWNQGTECAGPVTQTFYDGNPFFFPVDGIANAKDAGAAEAKVGDAYGYGSWPFEGDIEGLSHVKHNFHFTSEVTYWFRYDASKKAVLDFTGDDDVWVFVNGRLAVDLGGVHVPLNGSVEIGSATASKFALTDGKVYEIKVFHAERQTEGSSFRLTLSGFSTSRSDCTAVCGDGVIGVGEQCDDGVNDGGYNECQPGCVLGGFCGDGIVQEGEQCDDRAENVEHCSGCRILVVR